MSNTRKEIAARLGFAAMGPAPLKGSPARKAEIAQGKESAAERKKALLTKKNVAVLKRIESDYNDAMSEMRQLAAALAKKLAYVKSRTVNGDVDAEEYRSIFDEAATGIGQSIEVLNDYNFARSGAKAEFGLSPSEMKENQRRIETNIRYEAGEMRNLNSNMRFVREEIERLTAEIKNTRDIKKKAKLSLKLDVENKNMKDYIRFLQRARKNIQENQADAKSLGITLDPKWSANFSRAGAKAEFGRAEDVYRLLETTPGSYANYKKRDALVTEAMRLADITPAGKDVSLHELAEMVGQDLEADRSRMSRPGANKEAKAALDAWRLAVQKEEAYLGSVFVNPMKQREVEARTQAAYELAKRLNPDYQGFSRPGAKVSFDTYTDMVNELRRFTADSANVQYDWYTAANTWLGRKRTSGNKEIAVEANRAYDAVEREMRPKWRQSRPGAKAAMDLTDACWKGYEAVGTKQKDGKTVPNCVPMSRDEREEQKAGLKIMSAANPAVGAKVAKLIKEGKPQDQAIAIALDMQRRGEL